MKVKKLKQDAILPTIAYESDAGFDIYHCDADICIFPGKHKQIKLGISIEIEKDEVALMHERSGMAIKYGLKSIGPVIDAGYRGEISIILHNGGDEIFYINTGDKIGQIVVCKLGSRELIECEVLSDSQRGEKNHGSSGK